MSSPKAIARRIIETTLGRTPDALWRETFTHSDNIIFSARVGRKEYVLRMSDDPARIALATPHLTRFQKMGLPVQDVIATGTPQPTQPYAWMLLTRFAGRDVRFALSTMSDRQVDTLAKKIVDIERRVARIKPHTQFGFIGSVEDSPHKSWRDFITSEMRTKTAWREKDYPSLAATVALRKKMRELKTYFDTITPRYVLEDLTTKNVIIHRGRLAGIIDFDHILAGDTLFWLGHLAACLTVDCPHDMRYLHALEREMRIDATQKKIVEFYTAFSLFGFISMQKPRTAKRLLYVEASLIHNL